MDVRTALGVAATVYRSMLEINLAIIPRKYSPLCYTKSHTVARRQSEQSKRK